MPGLHGRTLHPEAISGPREASSISLPNSAESLKAWTASISSTTWLQAVRQTQNMPIESIEAPGLDEARRIARDSGKLFFRHGAENRLYTSLHHDEVMRIFWRDKSSSAH